MSLLALDKDQTNDMTYHRNFIRESQQLCPEVTSALRNASPLTLIAFDIQCEKHKGPLTET